MRRRLAANGVYMNWSYIVIEDRKVAYIVMQKVASTAIRASMLGVKADGKNNMQIHEQMRRSDCSVHELGPDVHDDYFVFTFVRNPFERLISCYENKYHTARSFRDDGAFDHYLLGYIAKDMGFRHFARRVCRIPDRLSDHHFVSQSFLIDRMGKNPKPDFIGHFERLAEEYEPIRQRYGFMPLPHHNKTPKKTSWMDYYDLRTARAVYRRYREDVERLGYRETYDKLIEHIKRRDGAEI